MNDPLRDIVRRLVATDADQATAIGEREWLVTNGLGGYASATVAGIARRKYHGLLVAALPNPLGRTVMLNHLSECMVGAHGERLALSAEERIGQAPSHAGMRHLREF